MNNTHKIGKRQRITIINVKKLIICILCIFSVGTLLSSCGFKSSINYGVKISEGPLSGKIIIVDAGHGGRDPGTIGVKTGVHEADINLEMSYKLKLELERLGASVALTRTKDATIELGDTEKLKSDKRSIVIEGANADMLLSIHQNFNEDNSSIRGVQILYADEKSKDLAKSLQKTFNKELSRNLNSIKNNYTILQFGNQPSVIVECGFLSNIDDEKLLQTVEYQNRIIKIICKQVIENLVS